MSFPQRRHSSHESHIFLRRVCHVHARRFAGPSFSPARRHSRESRIDRTKTKNDYLIDGSLRTWSGTMRDVTSPVCVLGEKGPVPHVLGSIPLMGEDEALQALEAAERAYGKGCGAWPTMSVGDRIRHMESFVHAWKRSRGRRPLHDVGDRQDPA